MRRVTGLMIGVSVVRDYFRPDIDPNTAMSQVSSLAISDMYYMPPGTLPPMVMPFDPTASVRQRVSLETRNSYFRLRNSLESLPVRELQVGHAREAVRLAEARYREQLGTIVELNEAETQLAEAEASNVTEIYTAKGAEAELRFAVGRR